MTIFDQIITWNKQRQLLDKGFNHQKEVSFIVEELLESTGKYDSISARTKAEQITADICQDLETDSEKIVDALADIIVFATGGIAKLGYDPNIVMDEVMKHINSRTGKIIDGKFVKDKDIEVYQPNFDKAKY